MATKAIDLMGNREKTFSVLPVVERETRIVTGMVHLHDLVAMGL
jgi:CBS domain-containing protein